MRKMILVEDEMCYTVEIERQVDLINIKTERRHLEREEEEANNRMRDELNLGTLHYCIK